MSEAAASRSAADYLREAEALPLVALDRLHDLRTPDDALAALAPVRRRFELDDEDLATLAGWAFFAHMPDLWAITGILTIGVVGMALDWIFGRLQKGVTYVE